MPRPNPAQLLYGSATVICSTLAMLLLSQTRSVVWTAAIAVTALALGLLVALTAPSAHARLRRRASVGRVTAPSPAQPARHGRPDALTASHATAAPAASATPAGMGVRH
ncbi:hypothetical protein [Streptomyces reniochalinae]|uniref:Uncharacterized protein n=1 Tax=Streptomyces reniochalinae TaxID=2250578 RepID=A0A367F3W0_9ACTN|nr:hypothetical protein [Streptomyces reniochalinae]RCG24552.1 hypothetical protein DQ392_02165 [Streptomyces reniochalinae]